MDPVDTVCRVCTVVNASCTCRVRALCYALRCGAFASAHCACLSLIRAILAQAVSFQNVCKHTLPLSFAHLVRPSSFLPLTSWFTVDVYFFSFVVCGTCRVSLSFRGCTAGATGYGSPESVPTALLDYRSSTNERLEGNLGQRLHDGYGFHCPRLSRRVSFCLLDGKVLLFGCFLLDPTVSLWHSRYGLLC